jgi:uncharacterized membrane protein
MQATAVAALLALVAIGLAWELWLAPLRPGGSWMVLKIVPLLLALRGLLHGRRYTYQWTSLLALAYFVEGVVRAWSDGGTVRALALVEVALALALFAAAVGYAKLTARSAG